MTKRPACPPTLDHPAWSVARRWDALLDAIPRALPAPTIHARNLFHLSAATWDAWAVYDPRLRATRGGRGRMDSARQQKTVPEVRSLDKRKRGLEPSPGSAG